MENIHQFLALIENVKGRGDKYTGRCPAHDDRVSSLSITVADDKILLKCHAGCAIEDILVPLKLTVKDLFFNGRQSKVTKDYQQRTIDKVYTYRDKDGKPLFEVVRFTPKSFAQRRPDGQWGLGNVVPVIYHLPEVLAAIQQRDQIFIVEGEKDADNLWNIGFVATTSPMGAGKWRDHYSGYFKDARVVIIPDRDKAGFSHASYIAAQLFDITFSLKLLELPDKTKDVSDWLTKGATWEDIVELVDAAPPYSPPEDTDDTLPMREFNMTDLGNAERLVFQYGRGIRYCYERKRWLVWTGSVWQWDSGDRIAILAKKSVRNIYHEVAGFDDSEQRTELIKHAKRSESDARIAAMVNLAQSEEGVPITVADMDKNPYLFNCENGTVDLRTGELLPHRRRDLNSIMVPYPYDTAASAPLWMGFLNQVTDGDLDLIHYLQVAIGYSLTGDTKSQVLFFLYGLGNNGKSTFLGIIRRMMGSYAIKANSDLFMLKDSRSSGPREELANLCGKRLVIASEVEADRRLAVVLIKEMTGGEAIRADRKYEHQVEFLPTHKVWIAGNHKPVITDTTLSIWRRVKLIPFMVTIPQESVDEDLPEKLATEIPGILKWAVQGCVEWCSNGFSEPTKVLDATMAYRHEQDILADFIADYCLLQPTALVSKSDLRTLYHAWCNETGTQPVTQRTFRNRLMEKGVTEIRYGTGRMWQGIGTKADLVEIADPENQGSGVKQFGFGDASDKSEG